MAKKIAAPRKADRKAPAGKKASSKKVTAPLRHKPKGSPKERLAYLNKDEMAALEKRKGTPARKGPRGLPSFADDSASSKGVSRGDNSGTKGSGSTKTSSGSVSKSSESKTSNSGAGSNSGRGQGGQNSGAGRDSSRGLGSGAGGAAIGKGYNSGTKGSRFGGASTQKPGMGRNAGRVGPQSPMGGQGTSFKTPEAAREDTFRRVTGIEDQRGLQNMPQRLYFDPSEGVVNPNIPRKEVERQDRAFEDYMKTLQRKSIAQERDTFQKTPQEISEAVRREDAARAARLKAKEQAEYSNKWPGQGRPHRDVAFTRAYRLNSERLPDIKIGGPHSGSGGGGYSGGGMGGTYRGGGWGDDSYYSGKGGKGWKAGGIVKSKSFKKK